MAPLRVCMGTCTFLCVRVCVCMHALVWTVQSEAVQTEQLVNRKKKHRGLDVSDIFQTVPFVLTQVCELLFIYLFHSDLRKFLFFSSQVWIVSGVHNKILDHIRYLYLVTLILFSFIWHNFLLIIFSYKSHPSKLISNRWILYLIYWSVIFFNLFSLTCTNLWNVGLS